MHSKLRIAIQKSGKLYSESVDFLRKAGIEFDTNSKALNINSTNFPLEILFLRDDDIPQFIDSGIAHIAIVGENKVIESGNFVRIIHSLGFGKCRLSIAIPNIDKYSKVQDLEGKTIATNHSRILSKYLNDRRVSSNIVNMHGALEIAPNVGFADAICDLVGTGQTLSDNNLRELEVVYKSQAVLISGIALPENLYPILNEFLFITKIRSRCPNSTDGEHDWIYPLLEDSIDKDRLVPLIYCRLCFLPK